MTLWDAETVDIQMVGIRSGLSCQPSLEWRGARGMGCAIARVGGSATRRLQRGVHGKVVRRVLTAYSF